MTGRFNRLYSLLCLAALALAPVEAAAQTRLMAIKGDRGPAGPQIVPKGAWVDGAYDQWDGVVHNNSWWYAAAAISAGQEPGVHANWIFWGTPPGATGWNARDTYGLTPGDTDEIATANVAAFNTALANTNPQSKLHAFYIPGSGTESRGFPINETIEFRGSGKTILGAGSGLTPRQSDPVWDYTSSNPNSNWGGHDSRLVWRNNTETAPLHAATMLRAHGTGIKIDGIAFRGSRLQTPNGTLDPQWRRAFIGIHYLAGEGSPISHKLYIPSSGFVGTYFGIVMAGRNYPLDFIGTSGNYSGSTAGWADSTRINFMEFGTGCATGILIRSSQAIGHSFGYLYGGSGPTATWNVQDRVAEATYDPAGATGPRSHYSPGRGLRDVIFICESVGAVAADEPVKLYGQSTSITGITAASPIVVTANGHGLANGDRVLIMSSSNTVANGAGVEGHHGRWAISDVTENQFSLVGSDGTRAGTGSGGTVRRDVLWNGVKISDGTATFRAVPDSGNNAVIRAERGGKINVQFMHLAPRRTALAIDFLDRNSSPITIQHLSIDGGGSEAQIIRMNQEIPPAPDSPTINIYGGNLPAERLPPPGDAFCMLRPCTLNISGWQGLRARMFRTKSVTTVSPARRRVTNINLRDSHMIATERAISGISAAAPIVVTTNVHHRFTTGQKVLISGSGNSVANHDGPEEGRWVITVLSTTTFSLDGSNGTGAGTGSGGYVFRGTTHPIDLLDEYVEYNGSNESTADWIWLKWSGLSLGRIRIPDGEFYSPGTPGAPNFPTGGVYHYEPVLQGGE